MFTANAKNKMGGYVGKKLYAIYIRDARRLGHVEIPWGQQSEVTFNGFKVRGEEDFRAEWGKLTAEEQKKAQLLLDAGQPEGQAKDLSYIEELKQLAQLREQGVITEEEFTAKKRQLLGLAGEGTEQKPPR
jgi:hypothetical protein